MQRLKRFLCVYIAVFLMLTLSPLFVLAEGDAPAESGPGSFDDSRADETALEVQSFSEPWQTEGDADDLPEPDACEENAGEIDEPVQAESAEEGDYPYGGELRREDEEGSYSEDIPFAGSDLGIADDADDIGLSSGLPDEYAGDEEPLVYYYEDDTMSVEAHISPDAVFAVDDTPVAGDNVSMTGDTEDMGQFSVLLEEYTGEVLTVDITFCDENGAVAEQLNGNAVLTVTIPAEDENSVLQDVEVYRLCEEGGGIEQVDDIRVDKDNRTVAFDTGVLTAYAVCYTVDFHYGDRECHMYGGSTMLLSELFSCLSIQLDAADVERIDFTNDELISFTRYGDEVDWVIRSLAPFDTVETMTLTFRDGTQLRIEVTDEGTYTESNNLDDFLTGWKITVGDTVYSDDTVDENTVIEYKDGMQYSLELSFAERLDLGFATPETDPPEMYYQLPDCFVVPQDFQMPLNVNLGRKGVLPNNIISVVSMIGEDGQTHNYLKLTWNWQDTLHWNYFRDSAQAKLKISVNGVFRDAEPNVLAINDKQIAIRREDLHNAVVNKQGTFNKETGIIDYIVTVSSQGTTSDISLTDTLGTALTYLTDEAHSGGIVYDSAASVNTAGTSPQITQKTGNTFNVVIPAMNNGDCLVFSYSASVDYDGIAVSGSPTFAETGNTAQIFGDSYDLDNVAMYHETGIEFSDLEKNCTGKRRQSVGGNYSYVLSWEIETNKRAQFPLADTEIKDTISPDIQSFSKYTGDGVTVKCYSEDGVLQETRQLSWEDLGVDLANDVTWTYHIPETDPLYRYVLTYDTIVHMEDQTDTVVAENTAEGKGGIDSDRAVLPIPGTSGIGVTKKATNVNSTHVTWEITLTVSGAAFDYERIVLQEHSDDSGQKWQRNTLPVRWLTPPGETSSRLVKETLEKVEVIGLEEGETFEVVYGREGYPDTQNHYYPAEGSNILEENFVGYRYGGDYCTLEFFKDSARTEGGLQRPEGESPSRTIVVRLTTRFPEEWAAYARDIAVAESSRSSYNFSHINWISVEAPDSSGTLKTRAFDTDKIMPMPPHVYKMVLRNQDTTAAGADEKKINILNYPNCIITNWTGSGSDYPDLPIFPVFYYMVLVNGVQYDEPLVIEDTFDTSLFDLLTVESFRSSPSFKPGWSVITETSRQGTHNYYPVVFGMAEYRNWIPDQNVQFEYASYRYGRGIYNAADTAESHGCTIERTETGFRITINELFKRADGSLYPFYGIGYYLIPKNLEALKQIEEMARANALAGGEQKVTFTNTASSRGTSASANIKIGVTNDFMPIDKDSETYLELMDNTRLKLQDVTTGGQTIRDTPDDISAESIHRYVMKYRIVLNKGKEKLNDGNYITVEDEYSSNLSVDFTTIKITTDPASAQSEVSYDYSGNIGYFTIPDETEVVIEYEAVVLQTTAAVVTTSNEVRMLQYKKTVEDHIDHGGASGSSATNPGILIKKYGSGHMEKGLNGAQFQLFEYKHATYTRGDPNTEADWEPVVLSLPEQHNAIFTTGNLTVNGTNYGDGYAEIELSESTDGVTLQTGKVYGLREIVTPVGTAPNGDTIHYHNPHGDNFYCYIFSICPDNGTADYSNYVFLSDDTMTVRNTPESLSLHMNKAIDGNCTLTDTEKDNLTYQLFRKHIPAEGQPAIYMPIMIGVDDPDTALHSEIIDQRFTGITYAQITGSSGMDITGLVVESGAMVGEYLLVEYGNDAILAAHPDWTWRGSYAWIDGTEGSFTNSNFTVYDENAENPHQVKGIEFVVTSQEIKDGENKSITITNRYDRTLLSLTAEKKWIGPSGSAISWPGGKTVTFTLGTLDDNDQFTPVAGVSPIILDNHKDTNGEDTAGKAVFKNLPKYELAGGELREVRYAVRETTSVQGYSVVYPSGVTDYAAFAADNAVIIRNQVESVSVSVSKSWSGQTPENATATFRLYAYTGSDPTAAAWVSNVNDITLDGTRDGDSATFGEIVPWRADFTGLPKYDSSGSLLHYIVKENSCTPTGYAPVEAFAENGGTITNRPASSTFTISKRWAGTPGNGWPDGETITLQLGRKTRAGVVDSTFSPTYVIASDRIVSQEGITNMYGEEDQQTGLWNNGTLSVGDLPKYNDSGTEWVYYASEVNVLDSDGTDVSGNYTTVYRDKNNYVINSAFAYSGGSITNTRSTRELTLTKTVSGNMADKSRTFDFTISLTNQNAGYNGSVAYESSSGSGTLNFVDGSAVVHLGHNESITLRNLSGSLQYTIVEQADSAAGYLTEYTVNGETVVSGRTISGSLSSNQTISCENTRQVVVPTGIHFPIAVFLVSMLLVLPGMILFARKRKPCD